MQLRLCSVLWVVSQDGVSHHMQLYQETLNLLLL
jgi:hypothetical protein